MVPPLFHVATLVAACGMCAWLAVSQGRHAFEMKGKEGKKKGRGAEE
jgi:hypothetical protein